LERDEGDFKEDLAPWRNQGNESAASDRPLSALSADGYRSVTAGELGALYLSSGAGGNAGDTDEAWSKAVSQPVSNSPAPMRSNNPLRISFFMFVSAFGVQRNIRGGMERFNCLLGKGEIDQDNGNASGASV
jgi:hypothetical protein